MSTISLDLRGLACPEPLMAFIDAAKKADVTEMEIHVDTEAAKGNISRAAASMGWRMASLAEDGHTTMKLSKKA